jgi:hypothetical protein
MANLSAVPAGGPSSAASGHLDIVGFEIFADMDLAEAPYTADYVFTANQQSYSFLVMTNATTGLLVINLYHGIIHGTLVDIPCLVRDNEDPTEPVVTVSLDMTIAADRAVVLSVYPRVLVDASSADNPLALQVAADESFTEDSTVIVVALGGTKLHQA